MKLLVLFLLAAACFGQATKFNPFTQKLDYVGAGSGSVTTSCGLTGTTALRRAETVTVASGTTYSTVLGDCGATVSLTNAGAKAVTLDNAAFVAGMGGTIRNDGAGTGTLTPASGTIGGAASITLELGEWLNWAFDGTNFLVTATNRLSVGSGLSQTRGRNGMVIDAAPEVLRTTGSYAASGSYDFRTGTVQMNYAAFISFAAANCQGTTASTAFATPTANAPAASCVTGTNTNYGTLDFDAATDESVQWHFPLPATWYGAVDVLIKWRAAATSGDVIWAVQTACVADGETGDPSFNTASTVTDTAKGTTLQFNDASMTTITVTGCAAGEELFFRLYRDADAGGDTMTGDAQLINATFTVRRTI